MRESIFDKIIKALRQSTLHNSSLMESPEVILWPDPESQWKEVIPLLQHELPELLTYGQFDPVQKSGPAIWIKCMVARLLPEADWEPHAVPIIYLPGISKADLRKVETAVFDLQPLLEYQYTGNLFLQENGKEWTVLAFVENVQHGLGIKVQKDNSTKQALKKALPSIFMEKEMFLNKSQIDAGFLNIMVFPEINESILQWMIHGDRFLESMDSSKRNVFIELCKGQFDFTLDIKNIKDIALKLGSQSGNWKNVWQLFANNPKKYAPIEEYLKLSMPVDLGVGMYALPRETWPQLNEAEENKLADALNALTKLDIPKAIKKLLELENQHKERRSWVWAELDKAPLAKSLSYLMKLAENSQFTFGNYSLEDLKDYYANEGYEVDHFMRKSLQTVKSTRDKEIISKVIRMFYMPWLESLTDRFQKLTEQDSSVFSHQTTVEETMDFILFVDAFRYELAKDYIQHLSKESPSIKFYMSTSWSAIPSLTPTAKVQVSPIASMVSVNSDCREFRPQLKNTKDLTTAAFRDALKDKGYEYVSKLSEIESGKKYWMEIGDIDTKGHQEQSGLVRRVEELFDQITETVEEIFSKGYTKLKIVTDHGWLLLPGGLPKTQLYAELTETRWGRCALMKEGAVTPLLQLPWRWNPSVFIAYAPGISFFKANEEYAHGGISIHECLVPEIVLESQFKPKHNAQIKHIKWVNLKCNVETAHAPDGYKLDVRTKASDENTSIVVSQNNLVRENKGRVMVNDDSEGKAATIVLLDSNGVIMDKKLTSVGG
ncbi:BREX-1 system phosphatase PglZ type B [Mongoliitalea lutea]|uniref:PglZ domain-containing protein n=1 Tax=Mongoliitalea lutea TaxID=849756 RepID=A0A8J3D1W8_9BACT|nr:BREX-1 system phosphatase PglZ type B [Mongoliitalea lutea]GHB48340.1 hypothetical protein GCM10008106_31420 [Mongoliitalea lutea]